MGTLSLCDSSDHKWYLNHGGNSQWQHLNQDRKVEHYLSMIIKFYDKGLGTSLQGQYLRCGRTHLSCAPPPQTADSHRSSRKVTPCLWRVRQVPIKRLAMTLSYLLQCEPDMTWHFTEFQTAQPSHGKFAFTQPSLWPDQIIKSQLHFQKRFFLAGCFAFLFSLPGISVIHVLDTQGYVITSFVGASRFMPFSTTSFSENPQIRVKVQMLECKCYFVETWTFLWKWLPKKKKQFQAVTTPPYVLILFVFSSGGKKSMPQLLWWVVFKPASFKALLHSEPVYCSSLTFYCGGWPCHSFTDNCFLTMFFFPLPLKGERPILSRMLMPCKSRSEAELRGSKLPSLLFGWALLKNSIRVLNHRQKKHCLQCWWAFFSRNTKSFSVSWKGDICQVCTWQKI